MLSGRTQVCPALNYYAVNTRSGCAASTGKQHSVDLWQHRVKLTARRFLSQPTMRTASRAFVAIHTVEALERFAVQASLSDSMREAIQDLTVVILHAVLARTTRKTLILVSQVLSISLFLPPSTPSSIFRGVQFDRLKSFSTSLPHDTIAAFISRTPTIRSLYIGCCGKRNTCALASVDLRLIEHLGCPVACVTPLIGPTTSVVIADRCSGNPRCLHSIPDVSLSLASSLTVLDINFAADDLHFMHAIVRAAPALTALKLVEVHRLTVDSRLIFSTPLADTLSTAPINASYLERLLTLGEHSPFP